MRLEATGKAGGVLVLDEIQKIPAWSETVKRLWDEDTRKKRSVKVVLPGSAPLLIAQGLTGDYACVRADFRSIYGKGFAVSKCSSRSLAASVSVFATQEQIVRHK